MIFKLETGYFIWNFSAWMGLFLFSALLFCLFTYIVMKNAGVRWVSEKLTSICDNDGFHEDIEDRAVLFKDKCLTPWFERPYFHFISVLVLFALFLITLLCRWGVE